MKVLRKALVINLLAMFVLLGCQSPAKTPSLQSSFDTANTSLAAIKEDALSIAGSTKEAATKEKALSIAIRSDYIAEAITAVISGAEQYDKQIESMQKQIDGYKKQLAQQNSWIIRLGYLAGGICVVIGILCWFVLQQQAKGIGLWCSGIAIILTDYFLQMYIKPVLFVFVAAAICAAAWYFWKYHDTILKSTKAMAQVPAAKAKAKK